MYCTDMFAFVASSDRFNQSYDIKLTCLVCNVRPQQRPIGTCKAIVDPTESMEVQQVVLPFLEPAKCDGNLMTYH